MSMLRWSRVFVHVSCARALLSGVCSSARAEGKNAIPAELPPPEEPSYQLLLDGSFAASGTTDTGSGGGAALRLGRVFPYDWVSLVPEVGVDYFAFSGPVEAQVFGGFAGSRVRFGRGVQPGVFAHVGVSGVRARDDYAAATVDVGLSLDFTFFPRMLLGFQGGYNSTIGSGAGPAFSWYTAGLSAGTRF